MNIRLLYRRQASLKPETQALSNLLSRLISIHVSFLKRIVSFPDSRNRIGLLVSTSSDLLDKALIFG